jgi:hypothetical protein
VKTATRATGSKFFQAKIAFEIPDSFEIEGRYGISEIPADLVGRLMRLFPGDAEFNTADVCSPNILIVDLHEMPTPERVSEMQQRIDAVLNG